MYFCHSMMLINILQSWNNEQMGFPSMSMDLSWQVQTALVWPVYEIYLT